MVMNARTHAYRLVVCAALGLGAATTFAQTPPAPQQGRGAAVGQIPIPQPCTPEQIAAAGQPAEAQPAGRARPRPRRRALPHARSA